ncbi:LEA type 2 family protein [Thermococcus atlanticus]
MALKYVAAFIVIVLLAYFGYVGYTVMTLQPQGRAEWGYVDENTTEVWITVDLGKPLLVPLSVEKLDASLEGIKFIRVERFDYSATGKTAKMAVAIDNKKLIKALVEYLNRGSRGDITLDFRGKVLGFIPLSYSLKKPVDVDPLSYINLTAKSEDIGPLKTPEVLGSRNEWGGVEGNTAIIYTYLKLYNPNPIPLPVTGLSARIYMDGITLGEGKIAKTVVIPAKGYGTAKIRLTVNLDSLPEVWVRHIKQGEVSTLRADLYLDISVGGFRYTHEVKAIEKQIRTNIMGDLNDILSSLRP